MPCEELRSSWKEVQFQLTRSNLQSVVEYIMRNGKTNGNITIRYGGRRQINLDFNETIDITKILNDLYNLGFVYIFIGCSDLTDPKVLGGQYMEGGRRQVCREASVPGESGVYRESVSRVLSGVAVSDGDAGNCRVKLQIWRKLGFKGHQSEGAKGRVLGNFRAERRRENDPDEPDRRDNPAVGRRDKNRG